MRNLFRILFKKITFFLLLSICVIACTNKKNDQNRQPNTFKNDSVVIWIDHGRNTDLTKEERQEFMKKAYERAQMMPNDSLKTKYFSELSLAYLKLNDSLRFRETNKRTIGLSKITNDSTSHGEAHWDLATFFRHYAVEDSAYYHYSRAQKIFQGLHNDFYAARMLYNMAVVQADVKDYTGSEINTIRAIELLKPLNKYEQLYNCYNNLATVENSLKEYDRALEYHNEALGYLKKIKNNSRLIQITENNIGVVYQEQGKQKMALSHFEKVLNDDSLKYKDPKYYAKALNNMAYSKLKLREDSELPGLFTQAIHIQDSIGDISGISRSYYCLADYYLSKKDTVAALTYAKEAKNYARESSNNKRLLETLELIVRLDPKKAAANTQEYIALNDSLQQEERGTRNKFARIQFETNEFIARNKLLAKQKQLLLGIGAGLLLLGGSILVIINQRVKNQKLKFKQKQQESNQEIFDLMLSQQGKLKEGKQQEQKRISEELHDGILGQMLGIRLVLISLNKKTDPESMAQRSQLIKNLQELEEEIRTISHELNDASYQKIHNFINSIDELLRTIRNTSEIEFYFDYDREVDWDGLSGDVKINIYRIVQESIQNCIKHGRAKNISVLFSATNSDLSVVVKDNGIGFDVKKRKRGIGLRNIKSRVEKLNGKVNITSQIGEGTSITIHIPNADDRSIKASSQQQTATPI